MNSKPAVDAMPDLTIGSTRMDKILWVLFSIFILYYKLTYHELWKDEWQAWLVARDQSMGQMLSFLNYEGHPSLWYLYLKLFTFLNSWLRDDVLLQFSHWLLVVITYWAVFIKFRLPLWVKVFAVLGYFFCFEYGIVNRGYVLVLMFAFFATYLLREQRILLASLMLFLLCNTEVYGVFIAIAISGYFYLEPFGGLHDLMHRLRQNGALFIATLAGVFTFALTVFPRGNEEDFSRAYVGEDMSIDHWLESFCGLFGNVFFPGFVPDTGIHGASLQSGLLGLLSLAMLYFLFKKKSSLLITLFMMIGMVLLFSSLIYGGGIRQYGVFFAFFICLLELSEFNGSSTKLERCVVFALLFFPVIHNVRGLLKDYQEPFSNSQLAGQYIRQSIDRNEPIVAINKFETTPVSGYAGRPFYELPEGVEFTWFKWLEKVYIPPQSELVLFARFKRKESLVLISPDPIDTEKYPLMESIAVFDGQNFKNENYFLYRLKLRFSK